MAGCLSAGAQSIYHVSRENGSNKNDGSKTAPFKNLQKALDVADDGATILVAEGNYFGMLNSGTIDIRKPVTIKGGYNGDFTERDVLKYKTMIQPSAESNGSAQGKGTMQITSIVAPGKQVVIDGDTTTITNFSRGGWGVPYGFNLSNGGLLSPDVVEQFIIE